MFEQATLTNGPAGTRAWTTFLGLTSQIALVSFAVAVPMLWPQVLPTARFLESLAPPLPPAPSRPLGNVVKLRPNRPVVVRFSHGLISPMRVPTTPILMIVDEPAGPMVAGVPAGFSGPDIGVAGGILDMARNAVPIAPPHIPEPVVKPAAHEAAPAIARYRVGGDVHLGAVLHRAEPQYPALAKAARVAGDVELECVVGVDGHIQEVHVKSGNPLLVRAAVDAAWQWTYGPSKLNGVPIEVITILRFSFKLN